MRCILSKFYIKPQLQIGDYFMPLCCILSKFYIKPQLVILSCVLSLSCILSKFYIKPQLRSSWRPIRRVVSYRNSTSNHNPLVREKTIKLLYLIEILHQTTTGRWKVDILLRCILSKFYIKPQRAPGCSDFERVVSYRNSTSNHNVAAEYYAAQVVVSYRNSTSNHNLVPIIS